MTFDWSENGRSKFSTGQHQILLVKMSEGSFDVHVSELNVPT